MAQAEARAHRRDATRDSSGDPARTPANPALSSFVRDAVREKASRELSLLRTQLQAFDNLKDAQDKLAEASAALTAFLGALASIGADTAAIGRAKKVRKLLDEAKDGADAVGEAVGLAARQDEARARREAILAELDAAGIQLEGIDAAAVAASVPSVPSVSAASVSASSAPVATATPAPATLAQGAQGSEGAEGADAAEAPAVSESADPEVAAAE